MSKELPDLPEPSIDDRLALAEDLRFKGSLDLRRRLMAVLEDEYPSRLTLSDEVFGEEFTNRVATAMGAAYEFGFDAGFAEAVAQGQRLGHDITIPPRDLDNDRGQA